MMRLWLNNLRRRFFPTTRRTLRSGRAITPTSLHFEALEGRVVPTLWTVNVATDNFSASGGNGSVAVHAVRCQFRVLG